jgi:hypothetical protein
MGQEVNLRELKAVALALIDSAIDANGGPSVRIDSSADFYWEVPPESLYLVRDEQPKLDVGRLSDDWEFIRPIAADANGATPLALIHLAPLLRYLAERVKP